MLAIGLYGLVAFAVIFCGGLLGLLIGKMMHERHRNEATQKIVQTAMGTVSLVAALVLGLLVATAKDKFDTNNKQTEEFAAGLMSLNRELVNYGPDANAIKSLLQKYTVAKIASNWPSESGPKPAAGDPPAWKLLESVQQGLRTITPNTDAQRLAVASALQTTADLTKATWQQAAQEADHVPHPFVVVLMVWLCVLFISFGLFAPRNRIVVMALFVCALSIAGAVVLVVDMDMPFEGTITVSSAPMHDALAKMNVP
ncbi:hypothetical protein G6L15_23235 [Agrobacterium rhizogenes]|uniref:bestrophin-like domain n=1 Tax=Rhizobium rhizogenes TaxID=359 RepID=UPI0015729F64|nr:hypothetical protein [Rhizobium rhizogenes]MDJ1638605.1 hypothetical protein [Rhizobium rhizogenes]NTG89077.1 hypothetical protein [Rhizobium rhizogenes]